MIVKERSMKKVIKTLIIIILLLIVIAGAAYLIYNHKVQEDTKDIYEQLQEQVEDDLEEEPEEKKVRIPIDFKKLKKANADIYAWIKVKGTRINYPIVQHPTDDNYYLYYTIDGIKGYPGSIYTQSCNEKDFTDFNTVIYGHNMKNGSMFHDLHLFEDEEFFEKHDKVTIYTETERKRYKIFAAVVYSDRHLIHGFNYDNAKGRKKFLQSLKDSHSMSNHYREDVVVDENSHIITMSTCIGSRPNNRYLVLAVEIDD